MFAVSSGFSCGYDLFQCELQMILHWHTLIFPVEPNLLVASHTFNPSVDGSMGLFFITISCCWVVYYFRLWAVETVSTMNHGFSLPEKSSIVSRNSCKELYNLFKWHNLITNFVCLFCLLFVDILYITVYINYIDFYLYHWSIFDSFSSLFFFVGFVV